MGPLCGCRVSHTFEHCISKPGKSWNLNYDHTNHLSASQVLESQLSMQQDSSEGHLFLKLITLLCAGIFGFSLFVSLEERKELCSLTKPQCLIMQSKNNKIVILFETRLYFTVFYTLPVRHKYITVQLIHIGSMPGKVRICTQEKKKNSFPL